MLSKIDQEIGFTRTALNLRAQRQEILASNLANSDTPNYKARDIDFASALKSALGGSGGALALTTTSSGHLPGLGAASGGTAADLLYRPSLQPSLDGNTVDPDVERANFADNSMHYQFLLNRLSGQFRTMTLAASADK